MENGLPAGIDTGFLVSLGAVAVVLTMAVYLELKESRIPNWLTVSGMLVGLAVGYLPGGISLRSSVLGLLMGFGFMFVFYMFGGIGGGDVKLMGAVGALVGHGLIGPTLIYTAIVGGFMAVMVLIWQKSFWSGLKRGMRMLIRGRPQEAAQEERKPTTIPYGIAIAAGCLLAMFGG